MVVFAVPRDWSEIALGVVRQFDSPRVSVFWGYLASATVIAVIVYLVRRPPGRAGVAGFVTFVLPPSPARRRAWHDVAILVVNSVAYSVLFLPIVQAISSGVGEGVWQQLFTRFGAVDPPLSGTAARVAMTLAALVVADLAFFVSHSLQHRVGLLWEFHKVHHSAETLTPFTAWRRHPIDVMIDTSLSSVALGTFYGVSGWLSGGALSAYTILGVNTILFCFLILGFNLQHSHVWLSFGPLDRVFVSPAMHQLHHSNDARHFGKNYGNVFALWDGLFGTLCRPQRAPEPVQFGLGAGENHEYRSLVRLYLWPLVKVTRPLFARAP